MVVFDDVSKQRELEQKVRLQAAHDALTGLHNRAHLEGEIHAQSRYARRYASAGAVLLLDLDGFELVNDSRGHAAGDRLLCEVAAALAEEAGPRALVARMDGDEFGVLLRECSSELAAETGRRLIAAIRERVKPAIGASVGLAVLDGGGSDGELLIAAAIALREAKDAGGGSAMLADRACLPQVTMVEQVREALAEERLVVYRSRSSRSRAAASSSRSCWCGCSMRAAASSSPAPSCRWPSASAWSSRSTTSWSARHWSWRARAARSRSTSPASRSATRGSPRGSRPRYTAGSTPAGSPSRSPRPRRSPTWPTPAALRPGSASSAARSRSTTSATGFSSFAYLKNIPAQLLKIDMDFIRELPRSEPDQHLVAAIVTVAESLGLQTVAEGVEDGETLRMVRELGIDFAQGHHLGRPQPVLTGMLSYPAAAQAVARVLVDQNSWERALRWRSTASSTRRSHSSE